MGGKVTIVAALGAVDEAVVDKFLKGIDGLDVAKAGPVRSVLGIEKLVSWIVEVGGDIGKVADSLIQMVEDKLAGASIKLKLGSMEVEITNVKRSQLMDLLKMAQEMARPIP